MPCTAVKGGAPARDGPTCSRRTPSSPPWLTGERRTGLSPGGDEHGETVPREGGGGAGGWARRAREGGCTLPLSSAKLRSTDSVNPRPVLSRVLPRYRHLL